MTADVHGHAAASVSFYGVLSVVVLLLVAYLHAAGKSRRAGGWSDWRSLAFAAGLALLLVASAPRLADSAHADLRGHMLQHLLLGMFAPLGLVLGAPGTLLLRTLPATAARRLVRLLDSAPVRLLIHPATALLFDIGGMYLLYLTPLYAWAMTVPAAQALVHVHFVLSGYLFTWAIAGPDPAPHRPGLKLRLAALFVAMAAHATLAKLMVAYGYPSGTGHSPDEIRAAAQMMYYGGDVAELLLVVAFFRIWFRSRRYGGGAHSAAGA